jgi:hypothetical protein
MSTAGQGNPDKHTSGDEHSARGFHYECALRCLWLLDLRGTGGRLAVADGEDAKIIQADGTTTYRQAKKKEGQSWSFDPSLRSFVARAYGRFKADSSVRHEFYTNAAISRGLLAKRRLNASHSGVRETAPEQTERFCSSIHFYSEPCRLEPSSMLRDVKYRLREVIDSAYPGCQASYFVTEHEFDLLAAKLLMVEYGIWNRRSAVAWHDVDGELGLDRLIADLYARSMADSSLTPFDTYLTVSEGGVDDEKTRAFEAVRAGRVVPRQKVEGDVWKLLDEWTSGVRSGSGQAGSRYLVVILAGSHGTGKTWSLLHIGSQLSAKYDGMRVCMASAYPPAGPFVFSNISISQPGPCAILIDNLFPDWHSFVSNSPFPPSHPLLILATAAQPVDSHGLLVLSERLGRRAKIVQVPDHLDSEDAVALARIRRVPLSTSERRRAVSTNIRHVVQLLSGIRAPTHLAEIEPFLSKPETLAILGPILLCTSLGVAIPKELLARSLGGALPLDLQPWVLGSRGTVPGPLSFEDPHEADTLLAKTLGAARGARSSMWCELLVGRVDPNRHEERAFARHLFGRLVCADQALCAGLLDKCRSAVDAILAREPLWALIFSWLPTFVDDRRGEVLDLALRSVSAGPTTEVDIAVLLQAYGVAPIRTLLVRQLHQCNAWSPGVLARFVGALMKLEKEDRRDTAVNLTRFLVDLPMSTFIDTLRLRSCFEECCNLASAFGLADDRRAFLCRVGEMIKARLESDETPKSNWFDSYRQLTKRVILQGRFGLSIAIVRQIIIEGNVQFPTREGYVTLLEQEQGLVHRPLVCLGMDLIEDMELPLPPLIGNLVAFTAAWGDDEEWVSIATAFVERLEVISGRQVAFDRLSAVLLPTFSAMRRGPRALCERYLRAILSWVPDKDRVSTRESSKLVLQLLSFAALQPWLDDTLRGAARKALLELIQSDDSARATIGGVVKTLRAALGMDDVNVEAVRMIDGWMSHPPLAKTYLTQVGRTRWEEGERNALAGILARTFAASPESVQNLTEALLRLGDLQSARKFAEKLARDARTYPDSTCYMAVISARQGNAYEGTQWLRKTAQMQKEFGRGPHPHLLLWLHKELAAVTSGRRKELHLLCAELCRDRRLRPYDDVTSGPTAEA